MRVGLALLGLVAVTGLSVLVSIAINEAVKGYKGWRRRRNNRW